MISPASSGISQPPITTTFQPGGGNNNVGTTDQVPREDTPQPKNAAAAESQTSQEQHLDRPREDNNVQDDNPENVVDARSETPRGSVVDFSV